jgi:hypothetical protein
MFPMQSLAPSSRRSDGHLWMIALGLSLLANVAIIGTLGFAALESAVLRRQSMPDSAPPGEAMATIFAEAATSDAAGEIAAATPLLEKRFARTTEDQAAPPEKNTAFIGERETRATSDRRPAPAAPPLPSQAGIAPKDDTDIETTQSAYQDGGLAGSSNPPPEIDPPPTPPAPPAPVPPAPVPPAPVPPEPSPPMDQAASEPSDRPAPESRPSTAAPQGKLLEGPNPVDVQVPREVAVDEEIKPTPESRPAAEPRPTPKPDAPKETAEAPKPKPSTEPQFRGFQRKTAVTGSISRTGRSALDVADSPLGRYQAAISRAVEQEWQRNCVRHRDYITPGFLTVRFFVETGGKVRSVQFVGDMATGEVQKGFTLNSIRNAGIPVMPPALRREYDKEPLELIFRFFF